MSLSLSTKKAFTYRDLISLDRLYPIPLATSLDKTHTWHASEAAASYHKRHIVTHKRLVTFSKGSWMRFGNSNLKMEVAFLHCCGASMKNHKEVAFFGTQRFKLESSKCIKITWLLKIMRLLFRLIIMTAALGLFLCRHSIHCTEKMSSLSQISSSPFLCCRYSHTVFGALRIGQMLLKRQIPWVNSWNSSLKLKNHMHSFKSGELFAYGSLGS